MNVGADDDVARIKDDVDGTEAGIEGAKIFLIGHSCSGARSDKRFFLETNNDRDKTKLEIIHFLYHPMKLSQRKLYCKPSWLSSASN